MTTHTPQRAQNTRLIRGQAIILHGGARATVIDFPNEEQVRLSYSSGATTIAYCDEVRTRSEALHHYHHMTAQIARELDDLGLMDATEQAAAFVERAAQQADAADAVRGLS